MSSFLKAQVLTLSDLGHSLAPLAMKRLIIKELYVLITVSNMPKFAYTTLHITTK